VLQPTWLPDPWGDCDCFSKTQQRNVLCSVDHVASCLAADGPPVQQQPCGCSGAKSSDSWVPEDILKSQVMMGGTGGGLLVLCCCCLCCFIEGKRYRQGWRRTGTVKLKDNPSISVSYQIQQSQSTNAPNDGKVHVVWDIGEKQLRLFEPKEEKLSAYAPVSMAMPVVEAAREGPPKALNNSGTAEDLASGTTGTGGDSSLDGLCPAYNEGAPVQYYSKTLNCWLTGSVHLCTIPCAVGIGRVCYTVKVPHVATDRFDTPLDALRPPMDLGETVEVFLKCGAVSAGGGAWVPGVIRGVAGVRSMGYYRVQLGDEVNAPGSDCRPGQLIDKVPAIRLRRSFPSGTSVEIYRGVAVGWARAVIVPSTRELAPPEPLTSRSPSVPATSNNTCPESSLPSSRSRTRSFDRSRSPVETQAPAAHPWTMVRVVEEQSNKEEGNNATHSVKVSEFAEAMPLYLIRPCRPTVISKGATSDARRVLAM